MMTGLHPFLYGILTMAGLVAALVFVRFYRMAADRLFLFFAAAFIGMALNWIALAMTDPTWEDRYQVFLLRLIAYAFILFGIIDKNRRVQRTTDARAR
jgi:hypothetical protein